MIHDARSTSEAEVQGHSGSSANKQSASKSMSTSSIGHQSPAPATATSGSPITDMAALLNNPTALEAYAAAGCRKLNMVLQEFCSHGTRGHCMRERWLAADIAGEAHQEQKLCERLHFRRVIEPHTDPTLGDCAYLAICRRSQSCKYVHYEIDEEDEAILDISRGGSGEHQQALASSPGHLSSPRGLLAPAVPVWLIPSERSEKSHPIGQQAPENPCNEGADDAQGQPEAQWVNIDVRTFDLSILGQFDVIMADPPWQIHMDLPYGTLTDDDIRRLDFPKLQPQGGLLFLWVTSRAMERAREIFHVWGYKQVEELIWIKTNQLQKVIRTGRTGHWLNHSKEHCLVAVKGNPRLNRHVDCDSIVAEARETSQKPDEVYGLIERMSPGSRKLEVFGRPHNIRSGWVTVGNQLSTTRLVEPEVLARFEAWCTGRQRAALRSSRQRDFTSV